MIMQIKIFKAREYLEVETDNLTDIALKAALRAGITALANKGMAQILTSDPEAKAKAKARAEENYKDMQGVSHV